jgi:cell division protease FtsH
MVRANEVAEVVISSTQIRGSLKKNNEQISAIRVEDPALLGELEQHGVKVTGDVQGGNWDWVLWLVPLALIFYMWSRGMRGLQGQGALSFGRSRAKVYAEDEVKITFADVAGIDEAIEELREIVDFLRNRKSTPRLADGFRRASCCSARREPARHCWREPWLERRTCRSLA